MEYFLRGELVVLRSRLSCYEHTLKGVARFDFETEGNRWIEKGILMPWREETTSDVLPLTVVIQPTKNKVRLVLDFR